MLESYFESDMTKLINEIFQTVTDSCILKLKFFSHKHFTIQPEIHFFFNSGLQIVSEFDPTNSMSSR
jgi:hypothetical protein